MSENVCGVVVLTGIIGSGKSTLLKEFKDKLDWPVFPEHISPLLDRFYTNPAAYGASLQFDALAHRIQTSYAALVIAHTGKIPVVDQYSLGDWAYAVLGANSGTISADAEKEYFAILHEYIRLLGIGNVVVHLNASIDRCQKSIMERGRTEEKTIPDAYLVGLQANMRAGRVIYPHYEPHGAWIDVDWENFGALEPVLQPVLRALEGQTLHALPDKRAIEALIARAEAAMRKFMPKENNE